MAINLKEPSGQAANVLYDGLGNIYLEFKTKLYTFSTDVELGIFEIINRSDLIKDSSSIRNKKLIQKNNQCLLKRRLIDELQFDDDYEEYEDYKIPEDELCDIIEDGESDDVFDFYNPGTDDILERTVTGFTTPASYDTYFVVGHCGSNDIRFMSKSKDTNSIRITIYSSGSIRYNRIGETVMFYKLIFRCGELTIVNDTFRQDNNG